MKTKWFCLLNITVSVMALTSVKGYIGNTEEELSKWYGVPADSSDLYRMEQAITRLYRFNGLDILVNIIDGRSWSEFYRKSDRSAFTRKEIETIVLGNTGRDLPPFTLTEGIWNSPLGNVAISYDPAHRALYLSSFEQPKKMDFGTGTTIIASIGSGRTRCRPRIPSMHFAP